MLKTAIIILLIVVIASLTTGFGFLVRDQGQAKSRRLLYALGIRIMLAATLLGLIFYGLSTGELGLNAPWHQG